MNRSTHHPLRRTLALACTMLAIVALPTPAWSQDNDPAQQEISRLRREIARLRQDLAEADTQIRELRARNQSLESLIRQAQETITDLRSALDSRPQDSSPATPSTAPQIPDEPSASPWSLHRELVARYRTAFASDVAPSDEQAPTIDPDAVDTWCQTVNRDIEGLTRWTVRFIEFHAPEPRTRTRRAWIELLGDEGEPIGPAFEVVVGDDIQRAAERGLFDRWIALVHIQPGAKFNKQRFDRGAFNVPPIIGPMAEFDPTFTIRRITGIEAEPTPNPDQPSAGQSDAPGSAERDQPGRRRQR